MPERWNARDLEQGGTSYEVRYRVEGDRMTLHYEGKEKSGRLVPATSDALQIEATARALLGDILRDHAQRS